MKRKGKLYRGVGFYTPMDIAPGETQIDIPDSQDIEDTDDQIFSLLDRLKMRLFGELKCGCHYHEVYKYVVMAGCKYHD